LHHDIAVLQYLELQYRQALVTRSIEGWIESKIICDANYVLHELGQPLHAFDTAKINGKINVKTVAAGTKSLP
jgi:hypothetical protein